MMKSAIKGNKPDYDPKESGPGELRYQFPYALQLQPSSGEKKSSKNDQERNRIEQITLISERMPTGRLG